MLKTTESPTVFLGSASESLIELGIIEDGLKPHAVITPWTNKSFFEAGRFILDSLIQKAPSFDFAVFIFGSDDVTISRGIEQASPRDNVIFETGLFMSQLGRERTLVVAPRGGATTIKVLSDIWGLKLVDYDPPQDRGNLWRALKPACEQITERIKEFGTRSLAECLVQQGPRNVMDAGQLVRDLIHKSLREKLTATVHNIALDMEITWPMLKDRIIENPAVENVIWRSLMIDPNSEVIKDITSRTVYTEAARKNQDEIMDACEASKAEMERRQIKFECRAYQSVPSIHGFLVNENVMLLTLCGLSSDGKLVGRPNPYWRFERAVSSETATHFFKVFEDWFSYHWSKGRRIWPK